MAKNIEESLDNRMRELRQARFLRQSDLADSVNVSRQTVIAIEKGEYNPSVALVLRITEVFKLPLEDVFWLSG
ncbi:MAG: transcriptional regulator [SAR202 cluster bacterium Casp-Chloro-G4]|nr:helix-turn-helix transcriptional regulator [Chloroflexota bacterium]MDA1228445.1 helix-turn-helix transcriptional regulator [Chloroflexota bacterium]PKB61743.1 MAG: transcriptional regulator [SAR202 cluster bacterium Casp-Chloro-G4]